MERVAKRIFREAFVKDRNDSDYYKQRKCVVLDKDEIAARMAIVAERVGVTLSKRDAIVGRWSEDGTYCWDGETIATGKRKITDIVHDIAHHQCSAPSRRHLPEWGLGTSPDGTREADLTITYHAARREETCASLLGILWEREIGSDWTNTMSFHNWLETDRAECIAAIIKTLKKLHSWGLVNEHGRPLPNMRPAKVGV